MMKTIFYFLLLAAPFLLSGCHNITVGYLLADEAAYAPDRMEVSNIHLKLAAQEAVLAEFTERAGSIQEEYDRENAVYLRLEAELTELNNMIHPMEDSVSKLLNPIKDAALIDDINNRLDRDYYPRQKELRQQSEEASARVHDAGLKLQKLADEMGVQSSAILRAEISELRERIKFGIPWVTSGIEGIQGTEPLIYEIVEVGNENAENAARFAGYLTIIGTGKMCLEQDFDVPDGDYVVTVKVSNEGRTRVFPKAFTFVVKTPVVKE